MAWLQTGDKSLPEPVMTRSLMHRQATMCECEREKKHTNLTPLHKQASDAIFVWHNGTWLKLVQLLGPGLHHHLNQYWFTINEVWHSPEGNFTGTAKGIIHNIHSLAQYCGNSITNTLQLPQSLINSLCPSDCMWWQIWVNFVPGNGLFPGGTKPLPEPMLIYHQ